MAGRSVAALAIQRNLDRAERRIDAGVCADNQAVDVEVGADAGGEETGQAGVFQLIETDAVVIIAAPIDQRDGDRTADRDARVIGHVRVVLQLDGEEAEVRLDMRIGQVGGDGQANGRRVAGGDVKALRSRQPGGQSQANCKVESRLDGDIQITATTKPQAGNGGTEIQVLLKGNRVELDRR